MPRPVIAPIFIISRLFIYITIFRLAYELNTILGLFIHSFIIANPAFGVLRCNCLVTQFEVPTQFQVFSDYNSFYLLLTIFLEGTDFGGGCGKFV